MLFFLAFCVLSLNTSETSQAPSEWTSKDVSITQQIPEVFFFNRNGGFLPKEENFSREKIPSQNLSQESCAAYDQFFLSCQCFEGILEGSDSAYEEITKSQPQSIRLKKESFLSLHGFVLRLLNSHPKLSAKELKSLLEKALLLHSLKNCEKFRALFSVHALESSDFKKEFLSLVKKNPSLFPSFSSLSEEEIELLFSTDHFSHFDSIFYLEGGQEMFRSIKDNLAQQKNALFSLDASLWIYLCSLSGALLTEESFLSLQIIHDSCHLLLEPKKQEEDAYRFCIERRANLLHLELKKSHDSALIRIASLLRLFSPHGGALLKEAFHGLSYAERESIFLQFEEKKTPLTTPSHIPTLLMNVFNDPSSGSSTKEKLKNTIAQTLPLISQILKDARERTELGLLDPKVSLSFQKAAQFAKEHPLDLSKASYQIDKEGKVSLFINPEAKKP